MLKGFTLLVLFLLLGEGASWLLHLPVPGNVVGMLLLVAALNLDLVQLADVKPAADLLVRNMALFFVPAGVGVIGYGAALREAWVPLVAASVVSMLLVLAVVGLLQQRGER